MEKQKVENIFEVTKAVFYTPREGVTWSCRQGELGYRPLFLFQRPDFRGLVLSDYQVAIGERARESVELLNKTTVS